MNNLIKINLLPYREEINKRKQQQFKTLMYGAVLIGLASVAGTYLFIDNMTNNQLERNALLETSIAHLDTELTEIQKLKQEKDAFLLKKNKIEELQLKRLQAANSGQHLSDFTRSRYCRFLPTKRQDIQRQPRRQYDEGHAQYRHIQST